MNPQPTTQDLNRQQTELRRLMTSKNDHQSAIALFLRHHAMLHSARMSQLGLWSYEDTILDDLSAAQIRSIPPHGEHSLAWIIWHLARIEDITLNLLVAGRDQVFEAQEWQGRLHVDLRHSGNEMDEDEVVRLSAALDIPVLRDYRVAVGRATREIVVALTAEQLKRKVAPQHIDRVRQQEAVNPAADAIIRYWSRRTVSGLLLMPPTRHCLVHLNEAARLKMKIA